MASSHDFTPVFDDPNLVGLAGLAPMLRLAESAGLHDLVAEHVNVPSPNAVAKATSVVVGMLAGADSIDDLDVLRHGAMGRLLSGLRAPSTLGTYLRSFSHGHVRQLDAVSSRLLAGLAGRVPALLAGAGPTGIGYVDVDDTIREVHGHAKQAAAFGYSGVRGLNAQLAVVSTPTAAPVIAAARLRKGSTRSGSGAARLLAEAIRTARAAGVTGRVMVRADSAYYRHDVVAAVRVGAWFSVTTRANPAINAAIAGIDQDAWTPIQYPHAVWEEGDEPGSGLGEGHWVSDAEVAEVSVTVFISRRKAEHITCRLVVRRVKRLNPAAVTAKGPGRGSVQEELFAAYRHHAFVTNSTLSTVEADAPAPRPRHRGTGHRRAEGRAAGAPAGQLRGQRGLAGHAVIAFNLARACGVAASTAHARARWATLRAQLIAVPGRVASSARKLTLHLPRDWPWEHAWQALFTTAYTTTRPPTAAAS